MPLGMSHNIENCVAEQTFSWFTSQADNRKKILVSSGNNQIDGKYVIISSQYCALESREERQNAGHNGTSVFLVTVVGESKSSGSEAKC